MKETKLNYKDIETLQYVLKSYIENIEGKNNVDLKLLTLKLIAMKSQLEYPKTKINN